MTDMTTDAIAMTTAADVKQLPLTVEAPGGGTLLEWAGNHQVWMGGCLQAHGALLLRGFGVHSSAAFEQLSPVLCGRLLDYVYRSTPRTVVGRRIYTATEYRADASIPMHNENAYARDWPMRLAFCCLEAASDGGETPLARSAGVTARIDAEIRRRFAASGVMYVRNYGQGVDLSWQTTFQTESRTEVEAFCGREGIAWEWLPDDRLRTRQVCQAMARHPVTRQELWFNQAHLFHLSSMRPDEQELMRGLFAEDDLPRQAYYGDGSPIDEDTLAHVREAFEAEIVTFTWRPGDVLVLDNMQVAHGRRPFKGTRRVLAAMGEPFSAQPRI